MLVRGLKVGVKESWDSVTCSPVLKGQKESYESEREVIRRTVFVNSFMLIRA
jgi:hypothetical protein